MLAGYVAIAANVVYSVFSIPLVLSYLDKDHFGLWALVTQLASYFALTEFGMTSSVQRYLIEYKNDKSNGKYGAVLITGFLALGVVALGILMIGGICSFFMADLFKIPAALSDEFRWLLLGQTVILSLTFATRMIGATLYVHQRQDISQLSSTGLFIIYFIFLWVGLKCGLGTYALLLNSGVGLLWSLTVDITTCSVLGFFPKKNEWGRPTWAEFKEIFAFSRDVFMMQIGEQLVAGSPMLLVSRLLGLDAAATYSICSKPFQILRQIVNRPFDFSVTMLCDMYIVGDRERMVRRWIQIVQITATSTLALFVTAAACNGRFVEIWTHGKIAWADLNNWVLGTLFIAMTLCRCFSGMVGIGKNIDRFKYLYFVELAVICGLSVLLVPKFGITAILLAQLIALLTCSTPAGVMETVRLTGVGAMDLFKKALVPLLYVMPLIFFLGYGVQKAVFSFSQSWASLLITGILCSLSSITIAIFFGLQRETRREVFQFLERFIPKKST